MNQAELRIDEMVQYDLFFIRHEKGVILTLRNQKGADAFLKINLKIAAPLLLRAVLLVNLPVLRLSLPLIIICMYCSLQLCFKMPIRNPTPAIVTIDNLFIYLLRLHSQTNKALPYHYLLRT